MGTPFVSRILRRFQIDHDLRTGGATYNGEETVLGIAMMMMGENSRTVSKAVDAKIQEVQSSLPQGVTIETVYDRCRLWWKKPLKRYKRTWSKAQSW